MNQWLQRKLYTCSTCGTPYLHDQAYHHALFTCSGGQGEPGVKGKKVLITPVAGGDLNGYGL